MLYALVFQILSTRIEYHRSLVQSFLFLFFFHFVVVVV